MLENSSTSTLSKINLFFQTAKLLHYRKRDLIFHAEDMSLDIFYIKSGYLRVYRISEQGEELTLTILKPGDFFPLTYGMQGTTIPYYLEAITALELWKAPQERFIAFIKANPDVLYDLTSQIMVRFDGVLTRIEYLIFSNAYIKVATTLLICAKKFGEYNGRDIVVQVPLTHRDISTFVGITRETTSLEIKKLEKKGYLGKKGRLFVIKEMKALEEEIYLATSESVSLNYSL
jgi:CRP-like cAMP-binding protein